MYQELENFSCRYGKAVLYVAVHNPIINPVVADRWLMVNGMVVLQRTVDCQYSKPIADAEYILISEDYKAKKFRVEKFQSEKTANMSWYNYAEKLRAMKLGGAYHNKEK